MNPRRHGTVPTPTDEKYANRTGLSLTDRKIIYQAESLPIRSDATPRLLPDDDGRHLIVQTAHRHYEIVLRVRPFLGS
jgi:hypothetical protein